MHWTNENNDNNNLNNNGKENYLKEIVEELRGIKEVLKETPRISTSAQPAIGNWFVSAIGSIKSLFKKGNSYALPASIIIAALLIIGAIFMTKNDVGNTDNKVVAGAKITDNVAKVTNDDHIRGDKKAKVVVVEYSDLECPFCQRFHTTMQEALQDYGNDVAWVYRHFPLESIHPRAFPQAVASECVAELGGNDKFWQFIDVIFASDQKNSDQQLGQMAQNIGINRSKFDTCLKSGKYDKLINEQTQNAQAAGGNGTPYSVVIGPDGSTYAINGAQPLATVKSTIDQALNSK
ncbi:MAG: hypothetical protein COV29_03745 [Candidatus Yanofskybacteria bacterium CG10_big_fil_rev_8_21_14_0_10_36_16]|uniref:Thioredoxin domain-containing protein n=1 Tax=Candidatus Yanofskybacteria bacterium CG10_big_fil_rev_8_21_14_0_10_36_16 TaxID=1975096 RepID=A0A2J0QA75_9BACT|nr:MAG: hypothetical protein COV29_03745 [Candidatus Yanofskybacteria bacterium CG10_big_fil_rev_8_21_14_0_10_36_16]